MYTSTLLGKSSSGDGRALPASPEDGRRQGQGSHRRVGASAGDGTVPQTPTANQPREPRFASIFLLFELDIILLGIFSKELMKTTKK